MIISIIISFVVYIFFPYFLLPKTPFGIGKETTMYHFKEITPGHVVWCLEIGLVTQVLIIVITEMLTSHAHKPTRMIAENTQEGSGKG